MGAPFSIKDFQIIKTPQGRFSPDKSLTNGPDFASTNPESALKWLSIE
jgi:hypothetical protein